MMSEDESTNDNVERNVWCNQELADRVAETALRHYNTVLPTKGKPKENEWTVYAAIVAHNRNDSNLKNSGRFWVVSCATGTKCTAVSTKNPSCLCQLRDSHGEVLARRGLVRVLWKEIQFFKRQRCHREQNKMSNETTDPNRMLLEEVVREGCAICYRLRPDIRLHLYISDSPCGDASIYTIKRLSSDKEDEISENVVQFTGAKAIVSEKTNLAALDLAGEVLAASEANVRVARECEQLVGILRTKSGRSNLEAHRRSTSMSCSDKIVRWSILGMQGGLLSVLISEPIRLSLIVVGRDNRSIQNTHEQQRALQRAITDRVLAARKTICQWIHQNHEHRNDVSIFVRKISPPTVFVTSHIFSRGKSATEFTAIYFPSTSPDRSDPNCITRKRKHCNFDDDDGCGRSSDLIIKSPCKLSPAGVSINWQQSGSGIELVVGARGIQQGKIPKCDSDFAKLQSRLCRNEIVGMHISIIVDENSRTNDKAKPQPRPDGIQAYREWKMKHTCRIFQSVRQIIFNHGPLAGWVVSDAVSTDKND